MRWLKWSPVFGCVVGVLCAALWLAGCYSPVHNNAQSEPEGNVQLVFWTLQLDAFADYINGMISTYEKAHPAVDIIWVDVPFQEAEKRALSAMLSDDVPDVLNLNPNFSALLAHRKALTNLSPLLTEKQKAAYLPVALDTVQLEKQTFAIPWYLTSHVTLANKKLLREAGLTSIPQSLDGLEALGNALRNKAGTATYAMMPTLSDKGGFLREALLAGARLVNPKTTQVALSKDPKAVALLAHWSRLYQQGFFPAESLTEGNQAAVQRYQAGATALLRAGVTLANNLKDNAPAIYQLTEAAPQFPAERPGLDVASMVLVVPKRSKHPKEALDFALFVTNASNQQRLSELAPVLPSSKASYAALMARLKKEPPSLLRDATLQSAQQLLKAQQTVPLHPQQALLNEWMDVAVQKAFLGQSTPKEALQWFDEQANAFLEKE